MLLNLSGSPGKRSERSLSAGPQSSGKITERMLGTLFSQHKDDRTILWVSGCPYGAEMGLKLCPALDFH